MLFSVYVNICLFRAAHDQKWGRDRNIGGFILTEIKMGLLIVRITT